MARKKTTGFESSLNRLEEIINEMESGEISLADSLALYKEGVELAALCGENLNGIEKEVCVLKKTADGIFTKEPLSDK